MQPRQLHTIQVADLINIPQQTNAQQVNVSDLMQTPPTDIAIEQVRERYSMFGDVPTGATIIIHKWGLYSLRYEGWAEFVWLDNALKRQRTTLRHKPLNEALKAYEASRHLAAA